MLKLMRSHNDNGNGHVGVEIAGRFFVGLYYYPWREVSVALVRCYRPTPTPAPEEK